MVNARKEDAVTEVVVKTPERVILELSLEEAKILQNILGNFECTGSVYKIYRALSDVNQKYPKGYIISLRNGGEEDITCLRYIHDK